MVQSAVFGADTELKDWTAACQHYLTMTYGKCLLCPPVVDDPVEVSKDLPRTHLNVIVKAEILLHELFQQCHDVLEVRQLSSCPNDCFAVDLAQPLKGLVPLC